MYEKKCLNYGASIFCSKQDMKNILGLKCNRNNAFVVANIYNNAAFAQHNFRDGYYNKNKLLFVGLLDYYPNVQGLAWFLDNIFNNFKKCFPDAKLDIVGRFPGIDVRNLIQKHIGAELHPDVDDLRPYYDNCRAVIVPLLIGGGTRIKILEAALANRPVLSTSFGANGLEFQDGKNILLFNDYNSFTEKYSKCLEIENYQRIVENAKKLVLDKYSKKQFNDQMQTVIKFVDNNVV
jgi:glycosyltransferase involved in cell wall biosynthesis